jgi:cytochrome c556
MGINDIAPFIDYENVNRNAPYDPTMIDRMSEAKGMLQQNVPIEMIIQQTGVPREILQQLLVSMQNIGRPTAPGTPPPVMSNQENKPTQQQMVDEFGLVGSNNAPEQIDARFKEIKMNPTDPLSNREQGMLDSYTGSGGIPSLPVQPEVANVMPENARLMPDAPNFMPDVDMPDNLGSDIADYLTDELGFDPATGGTVDKPSILQQLNQANATIALDAEDPNAAMKEVMNAQGEMSSLPVKEQLDIYRSALVDYYKEAGQKYKDLIKTPDEGLPFLVSGISLIESGEAGDNWMTALSKAGGKFAITKKQGQAKYDAQIQDIDIKNLMAADAGMADIIKKNIDYQMKLDFETKAGTRKEYILKKPGQTTENIVQLTSLEVANLKELYGENALRENDSTGAAGAQNNFKITFKDGRVVTTGLSTDAAKQYELDFKNGVIAGFEKAGVSSTPDTLQIGYRNRSKKGSGLWNFADVSLAQYNEYLNDPDLEVQAFKPTDTVEVIDKRDDSLRQISKQEFIVNADKYTMKGDVQATIQNGDSLITIGDSGGVSPFGPKASLVNTYVGDTKKQFANRKFMSKRMFETADTVLEIVDGMRAKGLNPDNAFNNIAGQAIGPATNLLTSLNSLGKVFENSSGTFEGQPIDKFKYQITLEDGTKESVTYNEFKNSIIKTDMFKKLEKDSSIGKFFSASNAERERIQAGLFTLAILSAGAMGGEGTTDMRAISDKDLVTQFERVGRMARDEESFRALLTDLKRDVLYQERSYLEAQSDLGSSDFYEYSARKKNEETGFMESVPVNAWDVKGLNDYYNTRLAEIETQIDALGPVSAASTRSSSPDGSTPVIEIKPTLVNGVEYRPEQSSGYTVAGSNQPASLAQLVAYAQNTPQEKKVNLLADIQAYLKNDPALLKAFLNMYAGKEQ